MKKNFVNYEDVKKELEKNLCQKCFKEIEILPDGKEKAGKILTALMNISYLKPSKSSSPKVLNRISDPQVQETQYNYYEVVAMHRCQSCKQEYEDVCHDVSITMLYEQGYFD